MEEGCGASSFGSQGVTQSHAKSEKVARSHGKSSRRATGGRGRQRGITEGHKPPPRARESHEERNKTETKESGGTMTLGVASEPPLSRKRRKLPFAAPLLLPPSPVPPSGVAGSLSRAGERAG